MSGLQDFRANAFVRNVLWPQLSFHDERSEGGIEGFYILDAIRNLLERERADEPDDVSDVKTAVKIMILLNDLELLNWGRKTGYFNNDSDAIWNEFWDWFRRYIDSVNESSLGFSDSFYHILTIMEEEQTWQFPARLEAETSSFVNDYSRNRDFEAVEVRDCLEIILFSTEEEWRLHLESLQMLSKALDEEPVLRLSDSELDKLSWALSGADILFNDSHSVGFDTQFPNLIERIMNKSGYVMIRRKDLEQARQQLVEPIMRLSTYGTDAALRGLQKSLDRATGNRAQQASNSEEKLREMLAANPRREIG